MSKKLKKSSYSIVEIYDIAMAQAELAGSHVAIDVQVLMFL
jgi:hypothetical protein